MHLQLPNQVLVPVEIVRTKREKTISINVIDGALRVLAPKLLSSDQIQKIIDGKSTEGMPIETAVKLIRGKRGTIVNIVFLRNGELIETSLKRTPKNSYYFFKKLIENNFIPN